MCIMSGLCLWLIGPPSSDLSGCVRGRGQDGRRGKREGARGREEGHTHEPTVHPASGPHLELDTEQEEGISGGKKKLQEETREKSSLCFTDSNGKMRNFL